MRRNMLLFVLLLSFGGVFAQEVNKVVVDPDLDEKILIGKCNRQGLESEIFAPYFNEEYNAYKPDQDIIKQLKRYRKNVQITVVMGTWCGDSQLQVPRFYKILDEIKFKDSDVDLICVDHNKKAGDLDISNLNIQRVPTFIFYKNGRELGRIVESPSSSLEKDMLLILMQGS